MLQYTGSMVGEQTAYQCMRLMLLSLVCMCSWPGCCLARPALTEFFQAPPNLVT
jgi:hypothetical protein